MFRALKGARALRGAPSGVAGTSAFRAFGGDRGVQGVLALPVGGRGESREAGKPCLSLARPVGLAALLLPRRLVTAAQNALRGTNSSDEPESPGKGWGRAPIAARLLLLDADLLEERIEGAFAAEEFLDGYVHIARVARLVNLGAQAMPGGFVEVALGRLLEHGGHVGGNGVRPGVAVIAGVIAHEMAEVGDKRRVGRHRQEHLAEYPVGERRRRFRCVGARESEA